MPPRAGVLFVTFFVGATVFMLMRATNWSSGVAVLGYVVSAAAVLVADVLWMRRAVLLGQVRDYAMAHRERFGMVADWLDDEPDLPTFHRSSTAAPVGPVRTDAS